MPALFQFNHVATDKIGSLSFSIEAGETRILKLGSQDIKTVVMDMALGDLSPVSGEILLLGQSLDASRPGSICLIPAHGGLISNLKTWENITLPLWYHNKREKKSTEESVMYWLRALDINSEEWEVFMSSPTARLKPDEHKMAGLLRGLVLAPQLLLVDATLFEDVDTARVQVWIAILEKFAREANDRAVLVVTSAVTSLPWKIIE